MQYTLMDLLRQAHIITGLKVLNAQEAIEELSKALSETGHVEPEFADDVWKREKIYPTGLPTKPVAVAMPHADPNHVKQSAMCIGVLKSPVEFGQMGTDGSVLLDVQLIFLLAIKEQEKQVQMIQQLVSLIQSSELLEALVKSESAEEAFALIKATSMQVQSRA